MPGNAFGNNHFASEDHVLDFLHLVFLNPERVTLGVEFDAGRIDVALKLHHLFLFGVLHQDLFVLPGHVEQVVVSGEREFGSLDRKLIGIQLTLGDKTLRLKLFAVLEHGIGLSQL